MQADTGQRLAISVALTQRPQRQYARLVVAGDRNPAGTLTALVALKRESDGRRVVTHSREGGLCRAEDFRAMLRDIRTIDLADTLAGLVQQASTNTGDGIDIDTLPQTGHASVGDTARPHLGFVEFAPGEEPNDVILKHAQDQIEGPLLPAVMFLRLSLPGGSTRYELWMPRQTPIALLFEVFRQEVAREYN